MRCRIVLFFVASGSLYLPCVAGQGTTSEPTVRRVYAASYPTLANLAGAVGEVRLAAAIDHDGRVQNVRILAGPVLLSLPAKGMLSRWLFSPCEETTMTCEAHVVFRFVLGPLSCGEADCGEEVQLDLPSTITISSRQRRAIVDKLTPTRQGPER
jgi:hypothetical protein